MPRGVYDRKKTKSRGAYKKREHKKSRRVELRAPINHVHFIRDGYNSSYRVWRSWDPGDYFDMIPIKDFEPHILAFVQKFPRLFVADFPEDDAGETICPLCKYNRE